jgi:cytochrome P450
VSGLEKHIRELCAQLLEPWTDGADYDFVVDFGATLPSMVICELLGVPASDREWVKDQIDTTFHIEPEVGMINDVSLMARIELDGFLMQLLEARRNSPEDDLLSGLAQTELSLRECSDFANLLVSAGTETVARLLGWAAVVLDEYADQRTELAGDPSLLPNTVEELLRYEAPSPVQGRWTTRSVELHGSEVPAGSKVLLLTGAAGRDERKYPDAHRFDIHRTFDNHVSFGFGIHFCLGAALARLEGRVALEEALQRHPDWEVDRERAVRLHTSTVRGWSSVPVH